MLANGDQKTHFGPHGDQRGSSGWAPTPPQQPCPIPFSLSPCEPRLFWQNQLAELIFKKKKPRQNWSRDHFEATQKANFSILKPNFWSGDTAMGMAHWHNPKRVNFFSNILQNHYFVRWNSYFYQHFSGWLFLANFQTRISYFFTMGLSPCTAWVGDRYIGEVISPFRTLPWQKMTAQFQFFQSLPHKKANFVKKSRPNMGYLYWIKSWAFLTFLKHSKPWKSVHKRGNQFVKGLRPLKVCIAFDIWCNVCLLLNFCPKVSSQSKPPF